MKNVQLLFLAFFCFQNSALAQEKPSKFRLELSVESIIIKGRQVKNNTRFYYLVMKGSYKYSTQVAGFWRLGARLEAGLGFAYTIRDDYTILFFPWVDQLTPTEGGFAQLRSLDFPFELRWKWLEKAKRFEPYASIGLNTRMPFSAQNRTPTGQLKLEPKETYVGASLGLGTFIPLFEKWSAIISLSAEKNLHTGLDKGYAVFKGSSLWLNEWSVNIGVGRNL